MAIQEPQLPINPAHIRRPTNLVPQTYRPPGGRWHPVQSTENWASLAAPLGISAWDLIRFNYPTLPTDLQLAAKEVNWYLEHYVGCTQLSPDFRNYRFNPPGGIWLPPPAAAATVPLTPDQLARQRVLAVLRGPVMPRMTFGVGFLIISASYYEQIAKAIEAGKIVVKLVPAHGHMAYYYSGAVPALIELGSSAGDGLIVHECTHAIFDLLKLTTSVQQSEAFGYLSQQLHEWLTRGGPPASRYIVSADYADPGSWVSWQAIFDESTRLAGKLATSHWVDESDAAALYTAIKGANSYRSRVGNVETNDGI
ncbi:MAG: hypothetical protein ABI972_04185 [Acidobacteriota bacterium]